MVDNTEIILTLMIIMKIMTMKLMVTIKFQRKVSTTTKIKITLTYDNTISQLLTRIIQICFKACLHRQSLL